MQVPVSSTLLVNGNYIAERLELEPLCQLFGV